MKGDTRGGIYKKPRDGVREIEKICRAVLKLQESDFKAMERVIKSREEFMHPLKSGTVMRQHSLAEHNRRVVDKLIELKKTIEIGPSE